MAEVARSTGLTVEVSKFETWDPAGREFDAVVAGQSWHWVDAEAGGRQVARVLRSTRWEHTYSTAEYLDLGTHHLTTAHVADLRDRVDAAVDAIGGSLTSPYETLTIAATRN